MSPLLKKIYVDIDETICTNNIDRDYSKAKPIHKNIKKIGLEIVWLHSLLFTRPDLQLFKDKSSRDETIKYIFQLIDICSYLEGKQLVFGSPKNRALHGNNYEKCKSQAVDDFYEISDCDIRSFHIPVGKQTNTTNYWNYDLSTFFTSFD